MSLQQFDIVIVGGGLAGMSLVCALADLPLKIALVEAREPLQMADVGFDNRAMALSLSSQRIFESLHCWEALQKFACPIQSVHVSDQGRFGITRLHANEHHVPAFGYVVEVHALVRELQQKTQALKNITWFAPSCVTDINTDSTGSVITLNQETRIQAQLLVAADGANSTVRQLLNVSAKKTDYGQSAIVANIGLARCHKNWAYERFTADGPLAFLPLINQRGTVIWSLKPEEIDYYLKMPPAQFLAKLQMAFGYRAGKFVRLGQRLSYPLSMTIADTMIHPGVVFIGNAAHSIHPIAGQGFNLGLRDVSLLAEHIANHDLKALNDYALLERYAKTRSRDLKTIIGFTDMLAKVFSRRSQPIACLRDLGLLALDSIKPLSHELVQYGMGLKGHIPKLACGQPLQQANFDDAIPHE